MDGVVFFREPGCERSGVLTTNDSKHLMCAMTNALLREGRVHILPRPYSRDPLGNRTRLLEQLEIFSYQVGFSSAICRGTC